MVRGAPVYLLPVNEQKIEAAMQFIEAQVLDALHLKLSQRLALSPGSKVFITITPPEELAAEYEAQAAPVCPGACRGLW